MTAFAHTGPGTRAARFCARLRQRLARLSPVVRAPRLVLRRLAAGPSTGRPARGVARPAPRGPGAPPNVQLRVTPRVVVNVAHRHEASGRGGLRLASRAAAGPPGPSGPAGRAGSPGAPAPARPGSLALTGAASRPGGAAATGPRATTDPVRRPRTSPPPMSVVAAPPAQVRAEPPAPQPAAAAQGTPAAWAPAGPPGPVMPELGPLTDRVISAIDRRIVAQRERLGSA